MTLIDSGKAAEKQAAKDKQAPAKDKGGGGKSKGKSRPRNPWAFERLEADIVKLEGERDELLAAMQKEENYTDASRMSDLQYRHAEVERELDEKNDTWANWE